MNDTMTDAITLSRLAGLVAQSVNIQPALKNVWVIAETSEVRVSGGHCYLELVEKDATDGRPLARMRAMIWSSVYGRLAARFHAETGSRITADMKLMVNVTVNYHPVYGLSAVINDINSQFALGEKARLRKEILSRLEKDGVAEMNKTIPMPRPPLRIAVISSPGAAGYGDFIHQLYDNQYGFDFRVTLFKATMQGKDTPRSIISALEHVAMKYDRFDCVAIIRGGGAVADLDSFDDYELSLNVAQFPIPVITGIGHERDMTVLDYISALSLKTPTAVAQWLIGRATDEIERVLGLGNEIISLCTDNLAGEYRRLSLAQGELAALLPNVLAKKSSELNRLSEIIATAMPDVLERQRVRLDNLEAIIAALSPEATLKRGFSITRYNGRAVSDASQIPLGAELETVLNKGVVTTTVIAKSE